MEFYDLQFGHYDLIDFVAVLLGYAVSSERTLEAFYESVHPFAAPFMALFGRERLPHRSTLSRFLAALNQAAVEALRTVFLEDFVARPLEKEEKTGGLWDRQGNCWVVFDVDGTRQAARQRALPCTPDLPSAHRRMDKVCASGYLGRKRGETVRTRTTVLQAHTHQWVGTFSGASGAGNGDYRGELRQAVKVISAYLQAQPLQLRQAVVHLDGQYGNGAIVADLAGLAYIMRARTMISSIWNRCKPAWPSRQTSRLPIPKREPVGCSSTFLISLFHQLDHAHGSSSHTQRLKLQRRSVPHVARASTSCSTRPCRQVHSLLLMWLPCICIVVPLRRCWLMKTRNKTRIAGVRTPPGARSSGSFLPNGRGTYA